MSDNLINVRQAADILNISRSTLYQWVYRGKLPAVFLSKRAIRFTVKALEEFILNNTKTRNKEQSPEKLSSKPKPALRGILVASRRSRLDDFLERAKAETAE